MAMYIAIGLVGEGVGAFLPDLVAATVLAAYLAVAPWAFARLTRSTTAGPTARWLVLILSGYAAGYLLFLVVSTL